MKICFDVLDKQEVQLALKIIAIFHPTSDEITQEELIKFLPIERTDFTARAYSCLKSEGIETIGELCRYSEKNLLATPNVGKTTLAEIKSFLKEKNLSLKKDIDER